MPYHVAKSSQCPASKPWACVKDADGKVMGCHPSKADAEKQMAALYANEPKASAEHRPFRTTRRIANLKQGRNEWYQIANATTTTPAAVHIFDEIGFFGVTASDFVRDLAGVTGDLDVHMNCPGGDVFEAVAIYNALKGHGQGIVKVFVDGLAASAASFIAQAADPGHLYIAKNASMMIHDAFGMGIGNSGDMRQLADLLDAQSDNIASIYADRSGQPVAQWREAMRAESWYVGQQAVDAGLADYVQGDPGISDSWDLSVFNGPGSIPVPQALVDDTPKIDLAGLDYDPDLFLSLLKEASA